QPSGRSEAQTNAGQAIVRQMAAAHSPIAPVAPIDPVPPGTEVAISRAKFGLAYHHTGVYVGGGQVVQVPAHPWDNVTALTRGPSRVTIVRSTLSDFVKSDTLQVGPSRP